MSGGIIDIYRALISETEDAILITLIDEASGANFAAIKLDPAAFARALVGTRRQSCTYTITNLDKLDKKLEEKYEWLPIPDDKAIDFSVKHASMIKNSAEEVDGWIADIDPVYDDTKVLTRVDNARIYKTKFKRYVSR